jgi:hypothetical protein
MNSKCLLSSTSVVVFLSGMAGAVFAQPAASYQGSLAKDGVAYNGTCDFQFSMWDAALCGVNITPQQAVNALSVNAGVFIATLPLPRWTTPARPSFCKCQ